MKGSLKIKIKDYEITVRGHAINATMIDHTAIVDALMTVFGLVGEKRKEACDMLLFADKVRTNRAETDKED